ncbi:MAG: PPK2 family polyphosphate kinase [Burkholderiaceae bacterium]
MNKCWLELDKKTTVGDLDGSATPGFSGSREEAEELTEQLRVELIDLQRRLFAESSRALLFVLQAMDTGGKDSTIRRVFSGVNPNGVRIARFQKPSAEEFAHDYLWRVHKQTPARGEIVIFNRSHYEDVLVVRTNKLVPKSVWSRRYKHISNFEQLLTDEGTHIIKIFLHIDKDEQRQRLQDRLDDPTKYWKFDEHDLEQRQHWDAYMDAFTDMIRKTSKSDAPWYIIPANRKWFRDYAVMNILVHTLRDMDPQYPAADGFDPSAIKLEYARDTGLVLWHSHAWNRY